MADRNAVLPRDEPIDLQQVPQSAAWLGGLGLIPFIVGSIVVLATEAIWAYDVLRYYAATILAFMGGVQWGLAMADAGAADQHHLLWRRLSLSVVPSLIAWLALLVSAPFDLIVIAAAFGLLLLSDLSAIRQGWAPAWYARLRIPLTATVLIALLLTVWATAG